MQELLDKTRSLSAEFAESGLYLDYLKCKEALLADAEVLRRVRDYKTVQMSFEAKRLNGGQVSFDEEKRVAGLYTELSLNPVAGAYLAAEYAMLKLYEAAFDALNDACDISL